MKADPKPPGPRKLNYTGHFGWQAGIEEQKRQKIQKTAKGASVACILPAAAPVPVPVTAVKAEEKPEEQSEVAHHGLGLTWESF